MLFYQLAWSLFAARLSSELKSLYNPLQPGQGMSDLLKEAPNNLNSIESTNMIDASTILKEAKADAVRLSKRTNLTKKPTFKTRGDAQEEADRRNFAYQAAALEPRKELLKTSPRK